MGRGPALTPRKGLQGTVAAYPPFLRDGQGKCADADPELFVTEGDRGARRARRLIEARSICATCPFRVPCAQWADDTNQSGVWGGTTTEQRRTRRALRMRYA